MKLHIPKEDLPPTIFYNPNPTIRKNLSDKSDSLKVNIKNDK